MERFSGRVAVVTGASHGIGEQVARDLAKAGMKVVATARRLNKLQELEATVKKEKAPGCIYPYAADLSKEKTVKNMFQWIDQHLGGVSILVNCACASFSQPPFQDMQEGDITEQMEVGVIGILSACKEMVHSARKHDIKDGHIVTVNSVDVNFVPDLPLSFSVYCAAKRATLHFNRFLRYDLKKIPNFKLKVTSVRPGSVETPGWSPQLLQMSPPEEMKLKASDVSKTVLHILASPPEVEITEVTIHPTGETF